MVKILFENSQFEKLFYLPKTNFQKTDIIRPIITSDQPVLELIYDEYAMSDDPKTALEEIYRLSGVLFSEENDEAKVKLDLLKQFVNGDNIKRGVNMDEFEETMNEETSDEISNKPSLVISTPKANENEESKMSTINEQSEDNQTLTEKSYKVSDTSLLTSEKIDLDKKTLSFGDNAIKGEDLIIPTSSLPNDYISFEKKISFEQSNKGKMLDEFEQYELQEDIVVETTEKTLKTSHQLMFTTLPDNDTHEG